MSWFFPNKNKPGDDDSEWVKEQLTTLLLEYLGGINNIFY